MTIRRVLIFVPLLVTFFLLQSYFWVPTYEQQTRGNPGRLKDYITASIGDASLLNPILLSDTASSEIEAMVFDRLIDLDEELRFRGRLATTWKIYEEAFFYVNQKTSIPGAGEASAEEIVDLLQKAKTEYFSASPELKASLDYIREISIVPPKEFVAIKHEKIQRGTKKKQR